MNRRLPTTLPELVDLAMDEAGVTSGRGLDEEIVRRLGDEHRVSYTLINAIRSGKYHSRPEPGTVRALATIARVPERVAFRVAGIPLLDPFELPDSASELTGDQRQAVLAVVRAFAKANRQSDTGAHLEVVPEAAMELERKGQRRRRERPGESTDPYLDT